MDDDFQKQLALEAEEQARKAQLGQNDPYTYVDQNDGTVYEWDHEKQAWFPKITQDFLAAYQANYGNYQAPKEEVSSDKSLAVNVTDTKKSTGAAKAGDKRKASDPTWFEVDDAHNTQVYVSGIPLDTTEEEFAELMSKCGMIMKDPVTNQYKLKMYRDKDGTLKGDGLCHYIKIESVELALNILDGYRIKDSTLTVERAKFQLKGNYDPSKKPKKKKNSKEKEKMKKKLDKLFDWRPDKLRGQRSKNEKTVIIKNMFEPKEFEGDATLILEYQKDVREECAKLGEVKKVVVYDRNPEGVVAVTFKEPEEADQCITVMNRRYFAGRLLSAETWDGKERYKVEETEEELEKRLKQWDDYLDQDDTGTAQTKEPSITPILISTPAPPKAPPTPAPPKAPPTPPAPSIPSSSGIDAQGGDLTDEEKHEGEDSDSGD